MHHQHRRIIGYQLHHSSFPFFSSLIIHSPSFSMSSLFFIIQDGIMKGLGMLLEYTMHSAFFSRRRRRRKMTRDVIVLLVWYKLLLVLVKDWLTMLVQSCIHCTRKNTVDRKSALMLSSETSMCACDLISNNTK